MSAWIWALLGTITGGTVGTFVVALCVAAKRGDER